MSTRRTTWTRRGPRWTICRWSGSRGRRSSPTSVVCRRRRVRSGPALPALGLLRPGSILLLATGWSRYWGTEDYLAHPWLTPEAAEAVVAAGVLTVGIDALSVDPTGPVDLPSHRVLCGAGGVIAENLTGLAGVADAQAAGCSTVFLFPLRLAGADGGPVRATARVTPHAR